MKEEELDRLNKYIIAEVITYFNRYGTNFDFEGIDWRETIKKHLADALFDAKISAEMTESIKRYEQAKEDGTLDKHFPTL